MVFQVHVAFDSPTHFAHFAMAMWYTLFDFRDKALKLELVLITACNYMKIASTISFHSIITIN